MPENLPPINEEMAEYELWRRSKKFGTWFKVGIYDAHEDDNLARKILSFGWDTDKCAIYRVERMLLVTYNESSFQTLASNPT